MAAARRVTGRPGGASPPRLLHHLAALLALAAARSEPALAGLLQRRRRQQRELVSRLMDPLPQTLSPQPGSGERFWRGLRWGGVGLLAGLWLRG